MPCVGDFNRTSPQTARCRDNRQTVELGKVGEGTDGGAARYSDQWYTGLSRFILGQHTTIGGDLVVLVRTREFNERMKDAVRVGTGGERIQKMRVKPWVDGRAGQEYRQQLINPVQFGSPIVQGG